MKVLIACEESQEVCKAFRSLGHEAYSWDLVIAHPPCTRLANSGVRWLAERNLWDDMEKATRFFNKFRGYHDAFGKPVAIENPIPHKYATEKIGFYSQLIQPWQFGHSEQKATCLWLHGLPKLKPTNIVEGREQRLHRLPPSIDRAKLRSKTFSGIAQAMAEQWGGYVSYQCSQLKTGCDATNNKQKAT
jgi:hypothetical protein